MRAFLIAGLAMLVSPVLLAASEPEPKEITVVPEATDEMLSNPGIGWETFHQTSKQDKNLPNWISSTVHYARWGWGELEPQPGKLNTEFLDKVLKETHDSGQKLAFRVMCCSTYKGHPYLKDADQEKPVGKDNSYWTEIKIVGGKGVPLKDGYFELASPEALLKENPKALTISWIAFYRG